MCTVSWIREETGYQLFFNRDEKRTRKPASPPIPGNTNGVSYIAPVDGDFGGTWIAANDRGLTVCLLNAPNAAGLRASRSRGLLIPELIGLQSAGAVREQLESADLSAFAPFTLAAIDRRPEAVVVEWDGLSRSIALRPEASGMLTSSSFNSGDVRSSRRQEYDRIEHSVEALLNFHHSHEAGPSAYSVCMHRSDAETVSFSAVRVSGEGVKLTYKPGAPCQNAGQQLAVELDWREGRELSLAASADSGIHAAGGRGCGNQQLAQGSVADAGALGNPDALLR